MEELLAETLDMLKRVRKGPEDVVWCGSKHYCFDWNKFANLASNLEYDNGFGAQHIAKDLVIVGKDWWLERHEYDGSEGWVFKTMPLKPDFIKNPISLGGDDKMWETLEAINEEQA